MKKLTKLLILSLSALTCFTACGNTSSSEVVPPSSSEAPVSSESQVDANAIIADAADFLWQTYKDINAHDITATFDLQDSVYIAGEKVSVSWKHEVKEGTAPEGAIGIKDGKFAIDYFGALITNTTQTFKVELTPTLTYGEVSKGLGDAMGKAERNVIKFNIPPIVFGDYEDWVALAKDSKTRIALKGTVVDIITEESKSSSAGSIYMVDDEGHGYYVYKPTAPASGKCKPGDQIVVSGYRSDYSGQEEFGAGASYGVLESGHQADIKFVDASADFAAAKSSSSTDEKLGAKYQNTPVVLNKINPTRIEGKYYYFTVGEGKAEYNLYENIYFTTDEQNKVWKDAFADAIDKGYTLSVKGIATVYSSKYQVYPTSLHPTFIEKDGELTDEQKFAHVETVLKSQISAVPYDQAATIEYALPSYATATYAVTSPEEGASVTVDGSKIKIAPIAADVENVVTATVKIGETTKEIDLTIVTENTSVVKYSTGNLDYTKIVAGTKSTTVDAVSVKNSNEKVSLTINHSDIGDASDYKEFNINKGSYVSFSAPEGYTIAKVEIDLYNFKNIDAYAGKDDAGTALEYVETKTSNYKSKCLVYTPEDCTDFYISNKSTYDNSVHYINITLAKPVEKYVADVITTANLALEDGASKTTTFKAAGAGEETVDVTVISNGASANSYNCISLGEKQDDTITISCPEGYKLAEVKVQCYGTYDNLVFYEGTSASGTKISAPGVVNSADKYLVNTISLNSNSLFICEETTYQVQIQKITVTVYKA